MDKVKEFLRILFFTVGGAVVGGVIGFLVVPFVGGWGILRHEKNLASLVFGVAGIIAGAIVGWEMGRGEPHIIWTGLGATVGARFGIFLFASISEVVFNRLSINAEEMSSSLFFAELLLGPIIGAVLAKQLAKKFSGTGSPGQARG